MDPNGRTSEDLYLLASSTCSKMKGLALVAKNKIFWYQNANFTQSKSHLSFRELLQIFNCCPELRRIQSDHFDFHLKNYTRIHKPRHASWPTSLLLQRSKAVTFASPSFAGLHFQLPPTIGLREKSAVFVSWNSVWKWDKGTQLWTAKLGLWTYETWLYLGRCQKSLHNDEDWRVTFKKAETEKMQFPSDWSSQHSKLNQHSKHHISPESKLQNCENLWRLWSQSWKPTITKPRRRYHSISLSTSQLQYPKSPNCRHNAMAWGLAIPYSSNPFPCKPWHECCREIVQLAS